MAAKRAMKTVESSVAAPIAAATEKLAKGEVRGALRGLLEAWRNKRAAAIADAIEALSARLTAKLPEVAGARPAEMHAAWIALAREANEADVDRLAPGLLAEPKNTLHERLSELLARPAEPRIATALFAMVRAPPTTASERFPMWTAIFKHLLALGDVRVRAPAEALATTPPAAFAGPWPQLETKFRGFLKALPKMTPPTLDAAEIAAVAGLRKAIAAVDDAAFTAAAARMTTQRATKSDAAEKTHEQFLAAIYADPEADGSRQVYADWLLEQGDPRGKFIAEQFAHRQPSGAPKLHKKGWIAPIAPLLEGVPAGLARRFRLEPSTNDSPESRAEHEPVASALGERFPAFRHAALATGEIELPGDAAED